MNFITFLFLISRTFTFNFETFHFECRTHFHFELHAVFLLNFERLFLISRALLSIVELFILNFARFYFQFLKLQTLFILNFACFYFQLWNFLFWISRDITFNCGTCYFECRSILDLFLKRCFMNLARFHSVFWTWHTSDFFYNSITNKYTEFVDILIPISVQSLYMRRSCDFFMINWLIIIQGQGRSMYWSITRQKNKCKNEGETGGLWLKGYIDRLEGEPRRTILRPCSVGQRWKWQEARSTVQAPTRMKIIIFNQRKNFQRIYALIFSPSHFISSWFIGNTIEASLFLHLRKAPFSYKILW